MPEGEPEDARVKDRISYSNSICQTDLTYVSIPVSLPFLNSDHAADNQESRW
jgi:hypothetical protein